MSTRNILVIIIIVVNLIVLYAKHSGGPVSQILPANPAPAFNWTDFEGNTHSLKKLKGHVVVLHFWASWCGPCREEFPELLHAAKALPEVTFLTISADDDLKDAQKFVAKEEDKTGFKAPPNMLFAYDDERHVIFDAFQTAMLPETIILDQQQDMRRKFVGGTHWEDAQIMGYLKTLQPKQNLKPQQ